MKNTFCMGLVSPAGANWVAQRQGWRVLLSAGLLFAVTGCHFDSPSHAPTLPAEVSEPAPVPDPPESFNLSAVVAETSQPKTFNLTWNDSEGADLYQVCLYDTSQENNCLALGETTTQTTQQVTLNNARLRTGMSFFVIASNEGGQASSSLLSPDSDTLLDAIGYFKASNTEENDSFGYSIALSGDGRTLAVSARYEDSSATGINGDQGNGVDTNSGAVYIFVNNDGVWSQQAYIKASNTQLNDYFGFYLALSADGNTLAVSAVYEDSNATGVNGDQNDDFLDEAGAVYVYTRNGSTWIQEAYIKSSAPDLDDYFGIALALNADGTTLVVSTYHEASNATGINGDDTDDSAGYAGAAYVFTKSAGVWSQQAYVKASNTSTGDRFGANVALSADGNTLAVGASREASATTGIDGNQADDSAPGAGAVYVFTRSGTTWSQQAYIKASNTGLGDEFGYSVSLSSDGNTLAVGAAYEDSNATGINGDETDDSAIDAGATYIFTRNAGLWSQQAYLKASNTEDADWFGWRVKLSGEGDTLVVCAIYEDSEATGLNGEQAGFDALDSGAAYLYTRSDGNWTQEAYLKQTNTGELDRFGYSIGINTDGSVIVISARREDSNATGINGDSANDDALVSGAVYWY